MSLPPVLPEPANPDWAASDREVKIALVDHWNLVREGLRALIERQPGLVVVAQAASVVDAWELAVGPDVIVTDIDLPGASYSEVIQGLRAWLPEAPILVVSTVGHPAKVQAAIAVRRPGLPVEDRRAQRSVLRHSGAPAG